MLSFFTSLFTWMPPVLANICIGVVVIFFLVTVLRIVKFILDLLPFL